MKSFLKVLSLGICALSLQFCESNVPETEDEIEPIIEFSYFGSESIINTDKTALDIEIFQFSTGGLRTTVNAGETFTTKISCYDLHTSIHECDSVKIMYPELGKSIVVKKIVPVDVQYVPYYWTGLDGKQREYSEKMPIYRYEINAEICH